LRSRIRHLVYAALLINLTPISSFSQSDVQPPLVEISGVKSNYRSCEPVKFSIRNVSKTPFYAEIYIENFKSGSWGTDDFPYNVHNPASLYEKLLTDSDKLSPSRSWALSYERCAKPRFVKQSAATFHRKIEEKDSQATQPLSQRIRVEIYALKENRIELLRKEWSTPFSRVMREQ